MRSPLTAKRPGLSTRASCLEVGVRYSRSLFTFLAQEAHEELEQVHEVEVEAERAEDRDFFDDVGTPSLGILLLDPLGVVGDQGREDQHADGGDDETHRA